MAYSEYSLSAAKSRLGLTTDESSDLFGAVPPLPVPPLLRQWLDDWAADSLAAGGERSRSEGIISPIIRTAAKLAPPPVRVFAGTTLDVDRERGLNGACDYVLTRSPERYFIEAPAVFVAEAKREDALAGYGQCAAGMVAARVLNERAGGPPRPVYGAVTSGSVWRFLRLDGDTLHIDATEYYLSDVGKILGVLVHMLSA